MKFAVSLFFLLVCAASAPAQIEAAADCSLKIAEAPALFNLRLGMTPNEAQTIFGRALKIKIKKNGNRVFFQNFIEKPAPPVLSGVRAVYLRFFDRRLYQIEIFYEERAEIKTVGDFIRNLSATLNLPDSWRDEGGRETIRCAEFTIFADKILNPRVDLIDDATRRSAEEFLEQQQKKK